MLVLSEVGIGPQLPTDLTGRGTPTQSFIQSYEKLTKDYNEQMRNFYERAFGKEALKEFDKMAKANAELLKTFGNVLGGCNPAATPAA